MSPPHSVLSLLSLFAHWRSEFEGQRLESFRRTSSSFRAVQNAQGSHVTSSTLDFFLSFFHNPSIFLTDLY